MTQATSEKSTASNLYELQATTSDQEIPKIYQGKVRPTQATISPVEKQ